MYESNGADGRMGDADQYKTKVDSETPMQIAAKIGCTVQDLLLINNQRKPTLHSSFRRHSWAMSEQVSVRAGPMFEKTPLRPHTKLLPNTWLLQPVPQTYAGRVVGHRPRGGTLLFRVVDTTDSVGYVVDEDRLRGALKTDRALVEADLVRTNEFSLM